MQALEVLEERLLVDMIISAAENDWFDFGGRALLLPKFAGAIKAKGILSIFLYAEHETIINHLAVNKKWRQRPTYTLAAEKSLDGKGWIANAEKHRNERLQTFIQHADIIIATDTKSPKKLFKK